MQESASAWRGDNFDQSHCRRMHHCKPSDGGRLMRIGIAEQDSGIRKLGVVVSAAELHFHRSLSPRVAATLKK